MLGGPDQRDDPSDDRDSQEKIQQEDRQRVTLAAGDGHDCGQEVHHKPRAEKVEEKHRKQMHTGLHATSLAPITTNLKQSRDSLWLFGPV
jgi:hypothetical protein